jgi:hypothetical protein
MRDFCPAPYDQRAGGKAATAAPARKSGDSGPEAGVT